LADSFTVFQVADQTFLTALAQVVLAGPLKPRSIVKRMVGLLGKKEEWMTPLSRKIVARLQGVERPRPSMVKAILQPQPTLDDFEWTPSLRKKAKEMEAWLTQIFDEGDLQWILPMEIAKLSPYRKIRWRPALRLASSNIEILQPTMGKRPSYLAHALPPITSLAKAAHWLELHPSYLSWLADRRSEERFAEGSSLRYRYRLLSKGRSRFRLIESPIRRLKFVQRWLLRDVLEAIPPHEAAHGFRRGRSIHTFIAPHLNRHFVLKIDLADFFPSITFSRVSAMFYAIGYPEPVARLFACLATNTAPCSAWVNDDRVPGELRSQLAALYGRPHLPQGAPCSPAIANLCAYGLDRRLTALAQTFGATYTRYADDLAFSGEEAFAADARRFQSYVGAIALEEGFRVNHRKTRFMPDSSQQKLAGVVVNHGGNIPRKEYDKLKAILTNCRRHGPASQNRQGCVDFQAHLAGKVAFVMRVNPTKGQHLQDLLNQIDWTQCATQ